MGWMQKCAETYDHNKHMIGRVVEGKSTLTPLYYIRQKAQIEITLHADGSFLSARELSKEQQETLIPATESSAVRTSGIEAHPLCDQLGYIAFGHPNAPELEGANEKERKTNQEKYRQYTELLGEWASSAHTHYMVDAVYRYVTGGTLLYDLVNFKLLTIGENGLLQNGKLAGTEPAKCLVRWVVLQDGEISECWLNPKLADCFAAFLAEKEQGEVQEDLCYVSGVHTKIAGSFPKGISKFDNGAKLLSANDESGFTYRGRFWDSAEAFRVGAEVSQKAHAALAWLTANQGKTYAGQTFVCWNPRGKEIPAFDADDDELFGGAKEEEIGYALTMPEYADRLKKAMAGYRQELGDREDILILAMKAATTGRMSITYYNELRSSDYLDRLESWHRDCVWYSCTTLKGKFCKEHLRSPSVGEIIDFCFGSEQGDFVNADPKLHKEHSQRIMHCIVDAASIPRDLAAAVTRKASVRVAYSERNYERLLFVACALIRAYQNGRHYKNTDGKEEWSMELDTQKRDRSYLFGRLLAVAEKVERSAYSNDEGGREPSAVRLQAAFAAHPRQTWETLEKALIPYYAKLKPGSRKYYRALRDDIVALFAEEDFKNTPLDGSYLLGYCLQRRELNQYNTNKNQENTEHTEENENGYHEEN